jgi:phosphocarrier protein HPr
VVKQEKIFRIINRLGLHARAAALIVQTANKFESQIYLIADAGRVSAKSIMGVLTLAAGFGSDITISAIGPDAEQAVVQIGELIENKFGEDS